MNIRKERRKVICRYGRRKAAELTAARFGKL